MSIFSKAEDNEEIVRLTRESGWSQDEANVGALDLQGSPFFLLQVVGFHENDDNNELETNLTMFGFDEPEQRAILKSMLKQIADSL